MGLSPVSVIRRCVQARPPNTPSVRPGPKTVNPRPRSRTSRPQGFGPWGNVARRRGRNAAPPELSRPGPFVGSCYCLPLAAYLSGRRVRAGISEQARTRPGRIGLAKFVLHKSHRLRTKQKTPAAHTPRGAWERGQRSCGIEFTQRNQLNGLVSARVEQLHSVSQEQPDREGVSAVNSFVGERVGRVPVPRPAGRREWKPPAIGRRLARAGCLCENGRR